MGAMQAALLTGSDTGDDIVARACESVSAIGGAAFVRRESLVRD